MISEPDTSGQDDSSAGTPVIRDGAASETQGLFAPVVEFGAAMLRWQARMFAMFFGTTKAEAGDDDNPGNEHQGSAPDEDVSQPVDLQPDPLTSAPGSEDPIGVDVRSMIAARAERISQTRPLDGQDENWLQAEREIQAERDQVAARAEQIATSPEGRGELDNWLQAEREVSATKLD